MKRATNRDAKRALFQGLAVFGVMFLVCIPLFQMEQWIQDLCSWVKAPWGLDAYLFHFFALPVFRVIVMVPVGFCLSLGFRFRGLKNRFCLNWGWIIMLAIWLIAFSAFLLYCFYLNNKLMLFGFSAILSCFQGLFAGHCLRAGLFAGKPIED